MFWQTQIKKNNFKVAADTLKGANTYFMSKNQYLWAIYIEISSFTHIVWVTSLVVGLSYDYLVIREEMGKFDW